MGGIAHFFGLAGYVFRATNAFVRYCLLVCNEKASAPDSGVLCQQDERWTLSHQEETAFQPRSDEKRILSHVAPSLKAPPALGTLDAFRQ